MAINCPQNLKPESLKDILSIFRGTDSNKDWGSVYCFIQLIIQLALDLALVVALIMILYGALLYLTSYGDESKAENGKKTLIWSIVGVTVIYFCKVLVGLVKTYLK